MASYNREILFFIGNTSMTKLFTNLANQPDAYLTPQQPNGLAPPGLTGFIGTDTVFVAIRVAASV